MAHHKSAEKRNRQRLVRTLRNKAVKTRVRRVLRKARSAVEAGAADAPELVKRASQLLDRAGSKTVMPRERVARLKSRLAKRLHAVSQASKG